MRKRKEIIAISSNDREFLEKLYLENEKLMLNTARKFVKTNIDAEDVVQDAIIRLLRNIPTLRELSDEERQYYIVLTVKATFLDSEKRKSKGECISLNQNLLDSVHYTNLVDDNIFSNLCLKIEIETLKRELPNRDWIILKGKYLQCYSQEELGKLINVAPDSVRMVLSRARKKAKRILIIYHSKEKD